MAQHPTIRYTVHVTKDAADFNDVLLLEIPRDNCNITSSKQIHVVGSFSSFFFFWIQVFYYFIDECITNGSCSKFNIEENTGIITAAQPGYNPSDDGDTMGLNVRVIDGAPSAIPGNPPGEPNQGGYQ